MHTCLNPAPGLGVNEEISSISKMTGNEMTGNMLQEIGKISRNQDRCILNLLLPFPLFCMTTSYCVYVSMYVR